MTIPTEIEKDIKTGKARYQTFQTGMGGQSVLIVPDNSYIIIFGYDYSPSGGGLQTFKEIQLQGQSFVDSSELIRPYETQQISFYTGQAFHPFIHHFNAETAPIDSGGQTFLVQSINTTPQKRGTYIISNANVAITVGLIQRVELNAASAIPVTDKTPNSLTYGGSAATPNVESKFSSSSPNPLDFVQPSLTDFLDYGLGGIPGNAQDQAFAIPDNVDGLIDASQQLELFGVTYREQAASNYFLNIHYALYTNTTPEALG